MGILLVLSLAAATPVPHPDWGRLPDTRAQRVKPLEAKPRPTHFTDRWGNRVEYRYRADGTTLIPYTMSMESRLRHDRGCPCRETGEGVCDCERQHEDVIPAGD